MNLVPILLTALLSSLATLMGAWLLYRLVLERRIDRMMDEVAGDFETRLRKAFEEVGEELVPEFRSEVEAGFREAGQDLLPDFRKSMQEGFHEAGQELLPELQQEVREGFKAGAVDLVSGDIVPETAQSVVRKGGSILSAFLNPKNGKR